MKVEKTLRILRETTNTGTRMSWWRYERGRGAEKIDGGGMDGGRDGEMDRWIDG